MADLASKLNIRVTWFYGDAGHGRGLIDAISSFGCKGPLTSAIITQDKWIDTASQMVDYLQNHFQNDEYKEYYLIDPKETAIKRQKPKVGHPIKGNRKLHVISVNQDGHFSTRQLLSDDENILNFKFDDNDDCDYNSQPNLAVDDEESEHDDEVGLDESDLFTDLIFESVREKTFIGLRSSSQSLELFCVLEIKSKGIADTYKIDK